MVPFTPAAVTEPARPVRHRLPSTLSPLEVLLSLRDHTAPTALVGSWDLGPLVTSAPLALVDERSGLDPFALMETLPRLTEPPPGPGFVGGGWIGGLGFPLDGTLERLPPLPHRPIPRPTWSLAYHDHVLRYDRTEGTWWFEALWTEERAAAIEARRSELARRLAAPPSPRRPVRLRDPRATPSAEAHRTAVAEIVERIGAGDVYQVNLCLRIDADLEGDGIDLFARTAGALAPTRGAYVHHPGALHAASLSPELFLRREGRHVRTSPIKGTAPRSVGAAELSASVKDRAEHVMIVDLMRNDLGRVCRPGTITVPALVRAEPHPGLWHLVSDVVGELADDAGDADLLRATFPPGSVTGAPKVAATATIHELEASARELYTGAIGMVSPTAGLELSVAIRTFELDGRRAWLGVGGGIVADSTPDGELAECLTKAWPLLAAAGVDGAPRLTADSAV